MQALEISDSSAVLSDKQRLALISLLVDDDPTIYRIVRQKILSYGDASGEWLRPYTLSSDPVMRRRVLEILHHQSRKGSNERFLSFCHHNGEDLDLEEAVGLLAQTHYPDINIEAYGALYDNWAAELRDRINLSEPPERTLGTINRYVFEELGFSGNEHYGYDPDCCYLNRVVDRRTGNPIGLCSLYMFLTRRLALPVIGIGLPGHFICRFQNSTKEIYIDCFRKGIFLTKADCIKYLLQANHGLSEGHLSPVSPRRMLTRMCANLHQTYGHLEMTEEAARVQHYLLALGK